MRAGADLSISRPWATFRRPHPPFICQYLQIVKIFFIYFNLWDNLLHLLFYFFYQNLPPPMDSTHSSYVNPALPKLRRSSQQQEKK